MVAGSSHSTVSAVSAQALGLHSQISNAYAWATERFSGASVLVLGSVASGKTWAESDIDIAVVCEEVPQDNPGISAKIAGPGRDEWTPLSVTLIPVAALERLADVPLGPGILQAVVPLTAFSEAVFALDLVGAGGTGDGSGGDGDGGGCASDGRGGGGDGDGGCAGDGSGGGGCAGNGCGPVERRHSDCRRNTVGHSKLDLRVATALLRLREKFKSACPSFSRHEVALCLTCLRNVRKAAHLGQQQDAYYMALSALDHAVRAAEWAKPAAPGKMVFAAASVEYARSYIDVADQARQLVAPVLIGISRDFACALAGKPAMSFLDLCRHFPEMSNGSATWDILIEALVENETLRTVETAQGHGVTELMYALNSTL